MPEADASADAGTGLPLIAARYRSGGDASTGTLRLSTATARKRYTKCRHMQFRLAGGLRLGQPITGGQPYDSVGRALECRAPRHTKRCRSERCEHMEAPSTTLKRRGDGSQSDKEPIAFGRLQGTFFNKKQRLVSACARTGEVQGRYHGYVCTST